MKKESEFESIMRRDSREFLAGLIVIAVLSVLVLSFMFKVAIDTMKIDREIECEKLKDNKN